MRLNVLGPLELVVDGRSVDVGAPRTKLVLSALAVNVNRVTPVEHLVDAVWDDSPPETARGQIQVCVSALRKVFAESGAPMAIRTLAPGYVLEVDEAALDFVGFDRLVELARVEADEGAQAAAVDRLRQALALWRGPALADMRSSLLERWAAARDERRMAAVESVVALELSLGRHDSVIGDLRLYVAEHPWRERLHVFLALALYRTGRQAEALEACAQARTVLAEELGLDPSDALKAVERAILTQDPSLNVAPPGAEDRLRHQHLAMVPRQLPTAVADFTDREDHLTAVDRFVLAGSDSRPPTGVRLVAISGTGGAGKTSLAVHLGHQFEDSFPDGQLYADLGGATGADVVARVLAGFLRALGFDGSVVPDDTGERAAMYRSRLAERRVLVVLDGVVNERQVEPLVPGAAGCLVIVTSRARLGGLPGALQVDLEALELDSSLELIRKIVGRDRVEAERGAAVTLANLCEGLPLALRIAGARLASRPHWSIGELATRMTDEARRLDELAHRGLEVRSAVAATYSCLDSPARRLLRLLSVMPATDFPSWPAAALLDCGLDEADGLLDELVDVHLLAVAQPGPTGRRYRLHDLVRAYAAEQLSSTESPSERDGALRRLLGGWVALVEDVHRADYGGDYTVLHSQAARWRPAGGLALPVDGNPYAVLDVERRALVAAVRAAADAGLDDLCWDLALSSIGLFELKGYYDEWRETATVALAAAEHAGNEVGRAAMRYALGDLHLNQQRFDEAMPLLAEALDRFRALGVTQGVGLALSRIAFVHGRRGNDEPMVECYTEAMQAFRAAGDRAGEAGALWSLAKHEMTRGDLGSAHQLLSDALRILEQTRGGRGRAQVLHQLAELHDRRGEVELARRTRQDVLQRVRQLGDNIGEVHALYGFAATLRRAGDLAAARATLSEALDLAVLRGERFIEARARLGLGELAAGDGQAAEAVRELTQAAEHFAAIGATPLQASALLTLAVVQLRLGRVQLAADFVDRVERLRPELDANAARELDTRLRAFQSALPAR